MVYSNTWAISPRIIDYYQIPSFRHYIQCQYHSSPRGAIMRLWLFWVRAASQQGTTVILNWEYGMKLLPGKTDQQNFPLSCMIMRFSMGLLYPCTGMHQYQCIPESKAHGASMGPSGAYRTQVGPMLAPWTLLSGIINLNGLITRGLH